jgi:hypothetical protein
MRSRFISSLAALFGLALGLTAASAEAAARTSSLGWVRGAGADTCVGTRALAEAVEARLGRPVFVSAARADVAVEGQIERGPAGEWRATIAVADEAGRVLGTRELRSEAMSCRDVDEQLALVIAVMIDPDAAMHAPPSPFVTPMPPVAPAPIALPLPVRIASPSFVAVHPEPLRVGLHLGLALSLGLLPNPGVGLALRGRVAPAGWPAIELGAAIWSANQAQSGAIGATFKLVEGFAAVCPRLTSVVSFQLDACFGVRAGVIQSGGFGFDLVEVNERPTFGPTLEGRLRRRLVGPLVVTIGPGLLASIVRDRFFFTGPSGAKLEVFRMAPLAFTLESTLGVEFP